MSKNLRTIFLISICILSAACNQQKKPAEQAQNGQGSFAIALENHPTPDDLDLINQVKQGNNRRVKSILGSGKAGIYSADESGQTALMVATSLKNNDAVEIILDKVESNDKNALDRGENTGKTALIYAAQNNAADIIKALRKKGANPNVYDQDKETPLYIAAKNNNKEAIEAILQDVNGSIPANPNLQNSAGATPVLAATMNKNNEVLKTLKDHGANFDLADATGISPLVYAASKNDKQLFDYLLTLGAKIDYLINNQKTVLISTIESGNNDFAKYILDKGANPNMHEKVLPTALQTLVTKENADPALVEYLITKGAKLNGEDMQNGNVISWAIRKGNAPAVRKLIEKGAKVTDLETANNSGVLMAVKADDPEMATLMIESGSDISKPDENGFTPLALAAKNGYQDVFVQLIKKGADVNAASRNKYATPLEIIFADGNADLLKAMYDNGLKVSPDAVLMRAISEKKTNLVAVALAYGARPNIMNSSGQPAIWLATAKDDTKAVEDLVDNSAILNVQDNEKGIPPLSLSIVRGNTELAKYLIEKGADPNLADKTGYTPLTYAAVTGQDEIVKLLLEHKADRNVKDVGGNGIPALVDLSKTRKEKKDLIKNLLVGK